MKAEDTVTIDLTGKTSIADAMVAAVRVHESISGRVRVGIIGALSQSKPPLLQQ